MKDNRLYARFSLDFRDHPKIRTLSDAAFRTLVEMTLWCREYQTDGFIRGDLVGSKREANALWLLEPCFELLRNDDVNPSLIEVENGYLIRDFAEHQTTRAEIEAKREVRKAAGRKGGVASGRSRRSRAEANAQAKRSQRTENREQSKEIVPTGLRTEPDTAGVSATPGADVVREVIPRTHPSATLTSLRLQASELINTGTDRDTVADALRLWLDKPNLGTGRTILASLCSEVIKTRAAPAFVNGHCLQGADLKAAQFQALKEPH